MQDKIIRNPHKPYFKDELNWNS